MNISGNKPKGAQAPIILYNKTKMTGNEWFQWYKKYISWLEILPEKQLNNLRIMGLTEAYYMKYINPIA